jgi:hypothetical protein
MLLERFSWRIGTALARLASIPRPARSPTARTSPSSQCATHCHIILCAPGFREPRAGSRRRGAAGPVVPSGPETGDGVPHNVGLRPTIPGHFAWETWSSPLAMRFPKRTHHTRVHQSPFGCISADLTPALAPVRDRFSAERDPRLAAAGYLVGRAVRPHNPPCRHSETATASTG